ncbi:MAG: BPSS1780 family membrane protein [Thiobacillaceae bacterium]
MNEEIPRILPASAGLQWVTLAFRLFRKNPLLLGAAFGLFMGALLAVNLIPLVGPAISEILTPLMVAGFMTAFRALDQGEELELPQFLAGLTSRPIPLAMVGALYLAALLAIAKIMQMLGLDTKALGEAANHGDVETMMKLVQQGMAALLTGLVLLTPILMATWMAPPLVLFGNAGPLQALGISLKACLRNWLPLTVYGVVLIPIVLMAGLIPFLLGMLVAGPILMGSLYTAYQDIFAVRGEQPPLIDAA